MSNVLVGALQLSCICSQGGLVLCNFSTWNAVRSHCEYLAPQTLPAFHLVILVGNVEKILIFTLAIQLLYLQFNICRKHSPT